MIDSVIDSAAFSWITGISIGAVAVILIGGFLRKLGITVGKFRPQILVVLFALSLIAVAGLVLNESNATSIAAGGLIALAQRIIQQDSNPSSN